MTGIVKSITQSLFGGGGKVQGPSDAEKAAQREARQRAFDDTAEANQISALSNRPAARSRALRFIDDRKKQSLGG